MAGLAVAGLMVGDAATAAAKTDGKSKAKVAMTASAYAAAFCPGYFEFQVAALDARDVVTAAVATPATEPSSARAQRADVAAAFDVAAKRSARIAHDVQAGPPHFPNGAPVVATTVAAATRGHDDLAGLARAARAVPVAKTTTYARGLRSLARDLERRLDALGTAYDGLRRVDKVRAAQHAFDATRDCDTLGGKLGTFTASPIATSVAPTTVAGASAPADGVPPILLPGGTAPTDAAVQVADRTAMSTRARLVFYGARPVVDAGTLFSSHCPKSEGSFLILGCYNRRTGDIYVLAVTRPELAGVVDVTAAHEMLHAAYERLGDRERADVDAMTAAYFATATDQHLLDQMAAYDKAEPLEHDNELHSLLGTEIAQLPPALEAYYAKYFSNRQAVVGAYASYVAVFDGIRRQRDALDAQLTELKHTLDDLEGQIGGAHATAQSLGAQIDSLRAQGRIAESNTLVGPQNAAVNQGRALIAQYNALVAQYNDLVHQYNALTVSGNDLLNALKPSA